MNLWPNAEFRFGYSRNLEGPVQWPRRQRGYSKGAAKTVGRAMKKRKGGTLKSGRSGKKVKSKKQAIAIGLSESAKERSQGPEETVKEIGSSRMK